MTATLTFFHGSLFRHLQVEDWYNCDFLFVLLYRSCKCSLTKMTTDSNHHSQLEEKENIETYARNACEEFWKSNCKGIGCNSEKSTEENMTACVEAQTKNKKVGLLPCNSKTLHNYNLQRNRCKQF